MLGDIGQGAVSPGSARAVQVCRPPATSITRPIERNIPPSSLVEPRRPRGPFGPLPRGDGGNKSLSPLRTREPNGSCSDHKDHSRNPLKYRSLRPESTTTPSIRLEQNPEGKLLCLCKSQTQILVLIYHAEIEVSCLSYSCINMYELSF